MKLVFTKGSNKYDRLDVYRQGHDVEVIDCPKQRIIPHDMVHYAVETTLRRRGFLGRVRDGESANFQMVGESESDGVERLVEVFQGDEWSGGLTPAQDMLDLYRVTCEARRCPALALGPADIEDVRRRIGVLTGQWKSVAVGGSLTLVF